MNEIRVNNIKKVFEGIVPEVTKEYTNQEIIDLLQNIQKTMIAGVYEQTHAEYMKERDLMIHFSSLAEEYGLKETATYKRFESNMADLGYTIGSFIKGMKGERIARKGFVINFVIVYVMVFIILILGAYGPGYSSSEFIYGGF